MNSELNFLVIEDDPVDAKAVCRILNRSGISQRTDTAASMEQAKQKVRRNRYDAVILDLGLPDSQGIDGILEFQATAPELPIVVLTGNEDERTALRSMDIGAEDFISKNSVTDDKLCRSVRYAIERHRRKSEVYRDMDSLRLSLKDAVRQASTDALTGLPNRRGLQYYLEQLSQANPIQPVIIGMADIDHFKSINDSHGHNIGDAVLKEFAGRLQHCLRNTDFAARIGGDEFVIVFGSLSRNEAQRLGHRMLNHVASTPARDSGKTIPFSATLAMAEIAPPFLDIEQMLLQTHPLLARGKEFGRNRVECSWGPDEAPPDKSSEAEEPDTLFPHERLLQHVREVNALSIQGSMGHYLSYGLGSASWSMSAPAVGRARLANRLSQMTLQCMRRAQDWREQNDPEGELHLDIEADAIRPWVCTEMTRIFKDPKSRANCVFFLHTDFQNHPGAASLSDIRLLRQAGFQLGARNIGDGSTILEHLQLLKPDWIRLDPALTINVGHYEKKAKALGQMVEMLRPLGSRLVADETEITEDLNQLIEFGFHAYYGEDRR
jgi:diguanylate cyclase (GGDEF)-like protein